jgi:hypothetical protein
MLIGMSVTLATVVPLPVRPVAEPTGWAEPFHDFIDQFEPTGWADRIHDVIDQFEELLDDGHAAEVVDLCQRAVWFLEDSAPEIADSAPLYELADRLGDVHLRACHAAPPEPVGLARWLFETEFRGDLGAVAGAAQSYSEVLGPEGLAELRRLASDAWRGPRGCTSIARSIDRFRLRPIMTSLARAAHPTAG